MTRVAVLGSGSWGTAFAQVLADAGTDVTLWGRRAELCARDQRHATRTPTTCRASPLPESTAGDPRRRRGTRGAEVVVLAVPSQTLRGNLEQMVTVAARATSVLVSLMKGIELGTTRRMSEVIAEVDRRRPERIAVVSGPNLAREIAAAAARRQRRRLHRPGRRREAAAGLHSRRTSGPTRTSTSSGVELGGAVKNVIALAVGMAEGMGFGDNSQASIITRGLAEIARLGLALGADPPTFAGLAGVGDLVATCMSPLSRNRTFGENLGRGMSVDEVMRATRQTAEGVKSCESILALGRRPRRRRCRSPSTSSQRCTTACRRERSCDGS